MEESNSKLALAEGLHNPSPPIHAGRASRSLSKSLTHLPVSAGINSLMMDNSRVLRKSEMPGRVHKK